MGFSKLLFSNLVWPAARIYFKFSFATASGFSGSTELSCMAGNHDQKRISNLPPEEPNQILIVFVITDEPSTIPSLPTSFVAAFFSPTHHSRRFGLAARTFGVEIVLLLSPLSLV